jgi:hypothetical protein
MHFDDFFLLKTDDWASEWEYRVVLKPGRPRVCAPPGDGRFRDVGGTAA